MRLADFGGGIAQGATRRFRGEEGQASPLDRLRLELDEAHPFGCMVGRDEESRRLRAAGLVRIMRRSAAKGLVHMDDVAVLSPELGTFSANIYLQNAAAGGELEIWPVAFYSSEVLEENAAAVALLTTMSGDPYAQRALREHVLPGPPLVISPRPGDLVLLCVQRPHAVRGPLHGSRPRISVQTFVSRAGPRAPLTMEV